jgi:hypothetical protein
MTKNSILLLAAACLTAGCAPQLWDKPGASDADFRIAESQCEARAFQMFPRELVTHQREAPQQTIIFDQRDTGRPVNYISSLPPRAQRAPIAMDFNEAPRRRAVDACLLEQGWRTVDSKGNPDSPGRGPSAGEVARILLLGY